MGVSSLRSLDGRGARPHTSRADLPLHILNLAIIIIILIAMVAAKILDRTKRSAIVRVMNLDSAVHVIQLDVRAAVG